MMNAMVLMLAVSALPQAPFPEQAPALPQAPFPEQAPAIQPPPCATCGYSCDCINCGCDCRAGAPVTLTRVSPVVTTSAGLFQGALTWQPQPQLMPVHQPAPVWRPAYQPVTYQPIQPAVRYTQPIYRSAPVFRPVPMMIAPARAVAGGC